MRDNIPYGSGTVSLGTTTGVGIGASGATFVTSESLTASVGITEVSSGAKDAGGTNAVNAVNIPDHSHTYTVPGVTVNYIIKT